MQQSFEHTHTLMTTSNLVEYDTSEGFETRLERLTSLGTMLSCTIYG